MRWREGARWLSAVLIGAVGGLFLFADSTHLWPRIAAASLTFAMALRHAVLNTWARRRVEPITAMRWLVTTSVLAWTFGLIG
jgi:hypothetical protein